MTKRIAPVCHGWIAAVLAVAINAGLLLETTALIAAPAERNWQSLFNGRDLDGWKPTPFGGEGEVRVVDKTIRVGIGSDLSGITWQREIPRTNIEISLECRRDAGFDFFCGLTFPVGDGDCSFIVGGWGGPVVGLSSIDGLDASENDTTRSESFESGRWYRVRVRSTPERIECFIDDKRVVDHPVQGHRFSVRNEMIPARPLGIATYATAASFRNLRWRTLDPD